MRKFKIKWTLTVWDGKEFFPVVKKMYNAIRLILAERRNK